MESENEEEEQKATSPPVLIDTLQRKSRYLIRLYTDYTPNCSQHNSKMFLFGFCKMGLRFSFLAEREGRQREVQQKGVRCERSTIWIFSLHLAAISPHIAARHSKQVYVYMCYSAFHQQGFGPILSYHRMTVVKPAGNTLSFTHTPHVLVPIKRLQTHKQTTYCTAGALEAAVWCRR